MYIENNSLDELLSIYSKEENITRTAKKFCKSNDIKYNDSIRKRVSIMLNAHWKGEKPKKSNKQNSPAKILIFDIETMPMEAYIWSIWQNNIGLHMLKDDWFMVSWSAKWLFEDEVISNVLTSKEALNEDDLRITQNLWNLLDEADIIIAHNGKKFDVKKVNTRFLYHKLNPPSPYILIDTLLTLRSKFSITSNKLDYVASEFFGFEGKIDTGGIELWKRCKKGEKKALKEMSKYNNQDIHILEEVYLRIRPWIQPHPNIGLYVDDNVSLCPTCGSDDLTWGEEYYTYANRYEACRCNNCGAIGRSRSSKIPTDRKKTINYSVPTR